jgi:hypothetical protein
MDNYDISINLPILINELFDPGNKKDFLYRLGILENHDPNKEEKSIFTAISNGHLEPIEEKYEILENMYEAQCTSIEWFIGFYLAKKVIKEFFKNKFDIPIKLSYFGEDVNNFINGFHHLCFNSKCSTSRNISLEWIGISKSSIYYNSLSNGRSCNYSNNNDIPDSDIIEHVPNFNIGTDVLISDIYSLDKNILLSFFIIACTSGARNTIIRLPPQYCWNTYTVSSILLFCMIYKKAKIFYFSVDESDAIRRFYLICSKRKRTIYDIPHRKIISLFYTNNGNIYDHRYQIFSEAMFTKIPEISAWLEKIIKIKENNNDHFCFEEILSDILELRIPL